MRLFTTLVLSTVVLGGLGLIGCDRQDDDARFEVEVGRDRSTAERVGDDVERAADRTGDAIRDAGDDLRRN